MDIVDNLRQFSQRIEDYKLQKEAELNRLYDRLAGEESSRRENYERLARDNADTDAIKSLDSAEDKEAKIKKKIHELREEGELELRRMRQELSEMREQAEREIREQLDVKRKELDQLRTEAIPRAQRQLDKLNDRHGLLDSETLVLASKLSELTRFDIETSDLEL